MIFPKIKIHLSTTDWIIEVVAGASITALLALIIADYPYMPNIVPLHFNSRGEVNRTGGKSNLLLLPLLGIVTHVLFTVAPKFPQLINYPFELTKKNVEKHFNNALSLMRVLKCLIAVGALYLTYTRFKYLSVRQMI